MIVCENAWPPKDSPTPSKVYKSKLTAYASEAALSEAIIKKLNAMPQTICQKIHGSASGKATLDIVGAHKGMMFWLEVKQPGKKPTLRQFNTMKKWIAAGAAASWTTTVSGAIDFVKSDAFLNNNEEKLLEGFHG